jgi:hypothetical protein
LSKWNQPLSLAWPPRDGKRNERMVLPIKWRASVILLAVGRAFVPAQSCNSIVQFRLLSFSFLKAGQECPLPTLQIAICKCVIGYLSFVSPSHRSTSSCCWYCKKAARGPLDPFWCLAAKCSHDGWRTCAGPL